MLACVCQPADPNIFRQHSPIPLGAAPLKIPSRGAIPKVVPGRSIRVIEPIVVVPTNENIIQDENNFTEPSSPMTVPLVEPNREALLSFGAGNITDEKYNVIEVSSTDASSILSNFSPLKKKCLKKLHVKVKNVTSLKTNKTDIAESNCDKENFSLSSKNCDKKLTDEPKEFPKVIFHL